MNRAEKVSNLLLAKEKLQPYINNALATLDQADIADVYIRAALLGVTLVDEDNLPPDKEPEITMYLTFLNLESIRKPFYLIPLPNIET